MTGMRDRELIEQLQKGNLEALGEIYYRYHQMVYRTAFAITGDQETASDLSQDVFLRLYRFAGKIDPKRSLEPWLYRITANLSYTWMKRNYIKPRIISAMAEWFQGGRGKQNPHDLTEQKEQWEQVELAISALPLAQRMVVVMYYLNDLSIQEIADSLEIPLGTVKSRLHYGRGALKKNLGLHQMHEEKKLTNLKFEGT